MAASALNSTIVRAFQALEHVAPEAGARWGARLWFTPPPPIPLDRLAQPPPGEETGVELDGRTLRATAWGSGPLVLLVHGWGGRSEQLAALVGPLTASGHRVVAFDAPGHGRSGPGALGGRRSTVPEFAAALRAAAAQDGGRVHAVVAHSFGATAAAFAVRLGLGPRVRSRLERRVLRTVGLPWAAFDPSAAARTVAVPPTLVVHDRHDREVPFDEGRRVVGAWPDARLIATDGLGHRRLLRDPGVVEAVARFVAASGAASPETGRWSA